MLCTCRRGVPIIDNISGATGRHTVAGRVERVDGARRAGAGHEQRLRQRGFL